jgi:putative glutamine amidotransferase
LIALLAGRFPEERCSVHRGYADALLAVGAAPVLVPAALADGSADWVLDVIEGLGCAGVVLTGGGDVAPATTGVPLHPTAMELDEARDLVELAVLDWARAGGVPVLGICRGIQLLVTGLGGTLVADLPAVGFDGHWHEDRQYEPVHGIDVRPGSLAQRALAGEREVNSIHHQAVDSPGPHLETTAWAPDGVIEAVEGPGLLGVQWHPERLTPASPAHLAPFEWLVGHD